MKLDKRRRLEGKTNYKKRLILLKGGNPRFVIRKTNQYLILQIIKSENAGDKVLFSVNSRDLLNKGWPEDRKGSLKSLPASYLSGYLLGKKSDVGSKVILDTGLIPSTAGSRVYAALKGASDAGMEIGFDEKVFPEEKRLKGESSKISLETFNKIKDSIE